jgi:drug/metabolite transporter (DMT)-like permease
MTFIILLQALFATSFPIGKYLVKLASPFIAGSILLLYQYFQPLTEFKIKRKHLWIFAQITILGMYATYGLRLYALQVLPTWKVAFFYNLSPFLSAFYAYLLFHERLSTKQWLGLCVGFLGMMPMLIAQTPEEATLGKFFYISIYELFLLISVSLHCYSWLLIQKLVKYKNYDTSIVNGICMASGGLLSLITSYLIEGPALVYDPIAFCKGITFTIFVSNILCHNIYAGLLKKYSATFMSFTSFLSPLFAALYGWAFFQETISWYFYLSIIIVLIGLYIFYQDELKNRSDLQEKEIQL